MRENVGMEIPIENEGVTAVVVISAVGSQQCVCVCITCVHARMCVCACVYIRTHISRDGCTYEGVTHCICSLW